ncbi:short-chain dehydrogenase/reductase [bacterium (Candidatus Blackallbacteria) CG17_big_fil_post_rev_8_21_14_2_50_48_46]|uniref:Short-chain dehydrogenase/reductase n=1 Tax=bacterium (Candidatus Blackallbacteria) CG17_big_fil_post_rev_8_21_14_2_50_48_46 TaxID=2014261 RepID=A0A2M7G2E5_9BACT|nr:MAG: short-chain dehydrogenase/reductase [bacterium (Candidatus Blackallbacteria) CG18_big_fil_WC_8_21_14_2_50_49_26]PIW15541.1 MAG: short-chain dehydrogenase/reductase [bacterium (Candidatus Blackallbacteria) CG17_big_fil_post_rev_8_21_14_2_50_48_46]PIW50283.1 MAG: short-chain dehydrogenase/reductase [bacterium (Candidatus Blackallbacteria) CG13_big_fil_rev_8_21_14_2_50_49_14]
MKTILITGCSSGFGLESAKYFLERGWKVIATMRTPREDLFPVSDNLRMLALDVTDADSIQAAVKEAGPIDVLVNNAGVGMLNALEGVSMDKVRELFETNTFGTIAMTQAVVPQMRERKSGVVVNVTSSVTLKSLPLLSLYTASKAAVNAFTESLFHELEPFNVRVNLLLPGRSPETSFAANAQAMMQSIPEAYSEQAQRVFANFTQSNTPITYAHDVAEALWQVVNDPSSPLRVPAGADAIDWAREAAKAS